MYYRYENADLFDGIPRTDFKALSGNLVIYGAGLQGLLTAWLLDKQGIKVRCFVDQDVKKQGTKYYGLPIVSPMEMKEKHPDVVPIVTPGVLLPAMHYVQKDLGYSNAVTPFSLFLEFNSDGFDQLDELPEWYRPNALDYHINHFLLRCVNLLTENSLCGTDISVTEICNLRCKHCNALMPCYENPRHFALEDVLSDLDTILQGRMFYHINIEGGETFLWKPLPKLLKHLNERENILKYIIPVTNGTVIPSEELLEALQLSKVSVKISDYGDISRKEEVIELFEKYHVKYWLQQQKWYALESLRKNPATSEEYIRVIYGCCKAEASSTRYISDGKLYCCPNQANYHKLGYFPSKEKEYVDLRKENTAELQQEISRFFDVKRATKPLPELCRFCRGRGFAGTEVPPAEQLKPGETIKVMFE